jgi:23S rRNA-/tRNA-specific pseudouridylate synthase
MDRSPRLTRARASTSSWPRRSLGSRAKVVTALERGKVFLNEVECTVGDARRGSSPATSCVVWMDRAGQRHPRGPGPYKSGALDILFEDDALIVLNKPAGLLSVPLERRSQSPSIVTLLEDYFRSSGKRKPFVVHRIDLDTSAWCCLPRRRWRSSASRISSAAASRSVSIWAVVYGHPAAQGTWRDRLVWDTKALIQKADAPERSQGVMRCPLPVVERFAERRSSRCGSRPASAIRFASRRACAATRWSGRSATCTARRAAADRVPAAGAARAPARVPSPVRRSAARVRSAAAPRHDPAAGPPATGVTPWA